MKDKHFIILIIITIISGVSIGLFGRWFKNHQAEKELWYNRVGIISAVGEEDGYTHDKFHNPVEYYKVLIRDVKDSTLFIEWVTTKEQYYNYQVGDTTKFRFINKNRYFKIYDKH